MKKNPLSMRLLPYQASEIAQRCNVSQNTANKWRLGAVLPRATRLHKLAALIGVPVDDLLNLLLTVREARHNEAKRNHPGKSRNRISKA